VGGEGFAEVLARRSAVAGGGPDLGVPRPGSAEDVARQVAEERERIAASLNEHLVRPLFAAGMALQSVIPDVDPRVAGRLGEVVDALDVAIAQIRSSVHGGTVRPAADQRRPVHGPGPVTPGR
jgi:signal transduction histidine kinase